ncbi:MAG: ABC transporter ATP-binding protein, partial [Clostridia bacterium]|nr:ABC transporter ATP-binding protein [Clostridia bacterium]
IAKIVPYVVRDIKSKIFAAMSKLSLSFFQRRETGSLMTRVLDDAEQVTNLFIEDAPKLMVDGITIVGVAISMFAISWPVAVAAIVFIPLSSLITIRVMPKMWVYFGMKFRASRNMNAHINDNLAGARVVRAFGQQDSEEKRFEKLNEKVKAAEFKIVGVQNELYATYHLIQNIGVFAVWGLGSFLVLKQFDFSYANIITLIGYVGMLSGPVSDISKALRQLANCMNSTQRIFEILDSKPDIKEKDNPVFPDHIKGDIKVDKITFGYEKDKPVLHELSFEVKAGEMLGVVGRSGAGKTTLLCLISRLYDPEDGNIFIDGINIRDMELDKLHRSIAVVSQETYIFMGTVAENIAYAYPDISRDKIIEAAIAASAHDFISKLPDGYDTIIGTSGRELSGGERQRISIARAILANPRILILDEATASMDTETEQNIQRSLEMLAKGRTTISVAHRLSTLRNADRLIVLEDGRLEESGTHNELIEKQGIYYRLAQLQSKSMTIEGDDMLWKTNDFMPRGPMGGPPPMGPPMGGPPPMGSMR